jgi:hypothetical protein
MLDIPCGDFNWMKNVDLSTVKYIGADIVDELIDENNKRYKTENINFQVINCITDPLPLVDLIFVRDFFVHLPYKDIFRALKRIKKSKSKYLLTTTFTNHHSNYDIKTGSWRPVNLQDKPFCFLNPDKIIIENCTQESGRWDDKSMGLWVIDKL